MLFFNKIITTIPILKRLYPSILSSLLIYIKKDIQNRIKVNTNDIVHVIVVRNNIAKLLQQVNQDSNKYQTLPDLYKKFDCGKCYQRDICHFHYTNYEKGNANYISKFANSPDAFNINKIYNSNQNPITEFSSDHMINIIIQNSNII